MLFLRRTSVINPINYIGDRSYIYLDANYYKKITNPYFTHSAPIKDWHLCSVFIPTNYYEKVDDIVDAINTAFELSFRNLYNITEHDYNGEYTMELDDESKLGVLKLSNGSELEISWSISDDNILLKIDNDLNLTIPTSDFTDVPFDERYFGGTITGVWDNNTITGTINDAPKIKRITAGAEPLLMDKYHLDNYLRIIDAGDAKIKWVEKLERQQGMTVTLRFVFDIMPVSSETPIFSSVEDFTTVGKTKGHSENLTIKLLPKIVEYRNGDYHVTETNIHNARYEYENSFVETYFNYFTIYKDLLKKLYFRNVVITPVDIIKNLTSAIYIINGKFYNEQFYKGTAYDLSLSYKNNILLDSDDKIEYYYRKIINSAGDPDLTIPRYVLVNTTQIKDVDKIINTQIKSNPIVKYETDKQKETYNVIVVNKTFELTSNSNLYLYLSSEELAYPFEPTFAYANVEYFK